MLKGYDWELRDQITQTTGTVFTLEFALALAETDRRKLEALLLEFDRYRRTRRGIGDTHEAGQVPT